jgi:hypothetical protein
MSVEPLTNVKEGAKLLRIDERTLRDWLAQEPPPFPVFRYGNRCVRFRLSDLVNWIESRTQQPRLVRGDRSDA